jgi:hypothetical protein
VMDRTMKVMQRVIKVMEGHTMVVERAITKGRRLYCRILVFFSRNIVAGGSQVVGVRAIRLFGIDSLCGCWEFRQGKI